MRMKVLNKRRAGVAIEAADGKYMKEERLTDAENSFYPRTDNRKLASVVALKAHRTRNDR